MYWKFVSFCVGEFISVRCGAGLRTVNIGAPADDVMMTSRARIDDATFYIIVCVVMTITELMSPTGAINWL